MDDEECVWILILHSPMAIWIEINGAVVGSLQGIKEKGG